MSQSISIFDQLKTRNGILINYYPRPSGFTTGGVSATSADWLETFFDYGLTNLVSAYMENGLIPVGNVNIHLPIKHFFNHRVFSIPTNLKFLQNDVSLVYLHEGWTLSNFLVAAYCFVHKIPYAVMPHGVYEPEIIRSLKMNSLRKIFEFLVLKHAKFVHIFFEGERKNVLKLCKSAKIAIAPTGLNQIENYDKSWIGDGNYFLFAGRIDPTFKGLDLLIESWKESGRSEILLLAGPDYNGGMSFVQNLINKLDLQNNVILLGNLTSSELNSHMKHARGFFHISRWESYGRSAIDAIRMGVPTLISDRMQISHVKQISNLAYITTLNTKDIVDGINLLGNLQVEDHKCRLDTNFDDFLEFLSWKRVMKSLVNQV